MKKEKNTYITPLLTVVEFKTERGYADSGDNLIINSQQAIQGFIDQQVAEQQMGIVDDGRVVAAQMGGNDDHTNAGSGSSWQYADGGWF